MSASKIKLSKKQIEYLIQYFLVFKKAYYMQTYKKLETFDQLLEVLEAGEFTFEDVFMNHIDNRLRDISLDALIYWDNNMELFGVDNYFPSKSKKCNDGAWIKIKTLNGFEIHWAKKANRKRRFEEEYQKLVTKYSNTLNRLTRSLKSLLKEENPNIDTLEEKTNIVNTKKNKLIKDKLSELELRISIGLEIYEVKIQRTKSKVEYYLPSQYEIIEDIEFYSDAYSNDVPGVDIKILYTSQNKDAIFYLQSRGISKKKAEMLAALKQTYFTCNMITASNAYHENLNKRVVFTKVN